MPDFLRRHEIDPMLLLVHFGFRRIEFELRHFGI